MDERASKAEALLHYEELKQRNALLRHIARNFAESYEETARHLRNNPAAMVFDIEYAAENNERLAEIIAELSVLRTKLQDTYSLLEKLGFRPSPPQQNDCK